MSVASNQRVMVESDNLQIVFRLGSTGFFLPIASLVGILEVESSQVDCSEPDPGNFLLGGFDFRSRRIELRDLAGVYGLACSESGVVVHLLVVTGRKSFWAMPVDAVEGIFPATEMRLVDLPEYLFKECSPFYGKLALWHGEPLICCNPLRLEECWAE